MKAMIFAAGLGTRLRPLTDTRPKALIDVGGVPMLERVLIRLKDCGVTDVVVNVYHFADMICDFLHEYGICDIMNVSVSDEREKLLDTGGGLLKAQSLLGDDDDILLYNADILTDFDIQPMVDWHKISGSDVSLLVGDRNTSRYLLLDDTNRMRGWCNSATREVRPSMPKSTVSGLHHRAFGGVHIVSPSIFESLDDYGHEHGDAFSIMPFYIKECSRLKITGYTPDRSYNWFDIGKPDSLERARQSLSSI